MGVLTEYFGFLKAGWKEYVDVEKHINNNFDLADNLFRTHSEEIKKKEPKITKKSGFNLEKSDNYNLNDTDVLLTTKGAKDLLNNLLNGAGAQYDTLKELQEAIQNNDVDIDKLLTNLSIYQTKEDGNLTTTSKKIVPAINEVNGKLQVINEIKDDIKKFGLKFVGEIVEEKATTTSSVWMDTGYVLTDAILESDFITIDIYAMFSNNRHSLLYPTDKLLKSEVVFGEGFHSGGEYSMNVKMRIREKKLQYFKQGSWANVKFFSISGYKIF